MKCAVFDEGRLVEVVSVNDISSIQVLISKYHPSKSILSSVILHDPAIETLLGSETHFHRLSHDSILPFTTPVKKPETIGADRLALAAAAVQFYPNMNNLIIG